MVGVQSCVRLMLVSLLASVAGVHAAAQDSRPIPPDVTDAIDAPEFRGASWGILVAPIGGGGPTLEINADRLFAPASVTKIFTCAAALQVLGADHRFETPVFRVGTPDAAGRLEGALVLRASGDPNLSGRITADGHLAWQNFDHIYAGGNPDVAVTDTDPYQGLRDLARAIAQAGIKSVGDVLVDARFFDEARGSGSGPERLVSIVINDNLIDFVIRPGAQAGAAASVDVRPQTPLVKDDADVRTVAAGGATQISVERPAPGRVVLRGTIEAGRAPIVRVIEVDDPVAFARAAFIGCLRDSGVEVRRTALAEQDQGQLPRAADYAALPIVARHVSPPLPVALRVILKTSHNFAASVLPLIFAAQRGERTLTAGMRIEGEALRTIGIDIEAMSLGGGAGGTTVDFVTPRVTVSLLQAMARRPDFAAFRDALPVLGVVGTLAKAVKPESVARGRVAAKTGTLAESSPLAGREYLRSKALAGYLDAKSGGRYALAIFVNNAPLRPGLTATDVGATLGHLCELLWARL